MKLAPANPDAKSALPASVVTDWLQPFLDYLAKERRYSAYTARNYAQAFADFHQWLQQSKRNGGDFTSLTARDTRDFVIEAQRRFKRRTLHNHVSGLRAFFRYWMQQGRIAQNPFAGVPLPKLEKGLPNFSPNRK